MLDTPCVYMAWNEILEKDKPRKPAVDCNLDCDHCGWNPEVAKKRIQKIRYEKSKQTTVPAGV